MEALGNRLVVHRQCLASNPLREFAGDQWRLSNANAAISRQNINSSVSNSRPTEFIRRPRVIRLSASSVSGRPTGALGAVGLEPGVRERRLGAVSGYTCGRSSDAQQGFQLFVVKDSRQPRAKRSAVLMTTWFAVEDIHPSAHATT